MNGNQKLWVIILLALAVVGGFYFYNTSMNQTPEETQNQDVNVTTPTQEPVNTQEEAMEEDSDEVTREDAIDAMESMEDGTASDEEPTSDSAMEDDTAMEQSENSVELESGNYYFDPAEITVSEGTVTVTNTSNNGTHTFVIDELGVREELETGREFTFEAEPGTYAFYCDIGNHRALGMEGTLTVQ